MAQRSGNGNARDMHTDPVKLAKILTRYARPSEPACKCCRSPSTGVRF